jgi:hypothetical protein
MYSTGVLRVRSTSTTSGLNILGELPKTQALLLVVVCTRYMIPIAQVT